MNVNSLTKILNISDFRIYQEHEWIAPFISLYFKEKDRVENQFFNGNGFELFGLYSYNSQKMPALSSSSKELFIGYRFMKDEKSNEYCHPFFLSVYQGGYHTLDTDPYTINGFATEIVSDQRFSRLLLLDKIIDYNQIFKLPNERDLYQRNDENLSLRYSLFNISEITKRKINENF